MTEEERVDAVLAHFGVKGMHWGVRRDRTGGSSGGSSAPKKAKPTTQEILDARARSDSRVAKIGEQINNHNLAKTEKGRQAAAAAITKIQKEAQPDLDIAKKLTTGEKVTNGVLLGATGLLILRTLA